jgi:hypothetical protein
MASARPLKSAFLDTSKRFVSDLAQVAAQAPNLPKVPGASRGFPKCC